MMIFGTRPEAIKMAPLYLEMKKQINYFDPITVVTAQHREMLDQVLTVFHIIPDYDLDVMEGSQTLAGITTRVLQGLEKIFASEQPDIVLVHGDTTTTLAASLSAFYHQIRIGHVEAGLRTWKKYLPYPEEMNRQLTDTLADLYFAPTSLSRDNLLKEGHNSQAIAVTGNTVIDALSRTVSKKFHHDVLKQIDPTHRIILLTMHRRENQGRPMRQVFRAIRDTVTLHPDVDVIYPVHLSPKVQEVAKEELSGSKRIHLIAPLDVIDFHNIAARSFFIMTDSGGVQEEAPSLNKPVLVLRDDTERPEGVKAGTLKLVGEDPRYIRQSMEQLLDDPAVYASMSHAKNPYGDGHASARILAFIQEKIG
ncbi:UDP-N-acetylglucosamine 2-epimerase [Oenococcus alcoholitolerans]|uniref:UDP-N-acetylglucosamine 2-epimerase (non-hydrolyzing) n=1 Tax=Oenococcus alcoholitolerans TaxID=931074 RepID=A0ABR4XSG0_9LACO|nr:UDP-N-acetylglucosamine 2-epimerase [Oenococcus alcoholitolerans]